MADKNKGPTKLTDKQERFVMAVIEGKSQSDAFRLAYDTSKYTEKSIHERASAMMANVKVKSRYEELHGKIRDKAEKKAIFTVEGVLNDMKELIERNKGEDDRVAIDGLKTVMKHLGMLTDKLELSGEIKMPTIIIGK